MTKRSTTAALRRRPLPRPPKVRSSARRVNVRRSRLDRDRVWAVSDELPLQIPVLPAEIEVIETYFGAILDEFLGGHAPGRSGLQVSTRSGTLSQKEDPK